MMRTKHDVNGDWWSLPAERQAPILDWIATFTDPRDTASVRLVSEGQVEAVIYLRNADGNRYLAPHDQEAPATKTLLLTVATPPPLQWWDDHGSGL